MNKYEEIAVSCRYFYEVLITKYLELEKYMHNQEKSILSIFKKIDFLERVYLLEDLLGKALEVKEELENINSKAIFTNDDLQFFNDLNYSISLYLNLLDENIKLHKNLYAKANNVKYTYKSYKNDLNNCKKVRDILQNQLYVLQKSYERYLNKYKNTFLAK